jgi:hypothetical protein
VIRSFNLSAPTRPAMALNVGAGVPWIEPPCLLSIAWQPEHACSAMALPRATSAPVCARTAIVGEATSIATSTIALLDMSILLNPRFSHSMSDYPCPTNHHRWLRRIRQSKRAVERCCRLGVPAESRLPKPLFSTGKLMAAPRRIGIRAYEIDEEPQVLKVLGGDFGNVHQASDESAAALVARCS